MDINRAVSLPRGGFSEIEWMPGDYARWKEVLSKLYAKAEPLGDELQKELQRLRKTYKLDKYYRFTYENN